MNAKRLLVLAALTLSLVTSAGAFSSVDADRRATVTVVNDTQAYLSIEEANELTVPLSGADRTLFVVGNHFVQTVTITATATTPNTSAVRVTVIRPDENGDPTNVGDEIEIVAEIECDALVTDADVEVTVGAVGQTVSATRYDKTVHVTCILGTGSVG